jgi:hypothetical protein
MLLATPIIRPRLPFIKLLLMCVVSEVKKVPVFPGPLE